MVFCYIYFTIHSIFLVCYIQFRELLVYGADVLARNNDFETPLDIVGGIDSAEIRSMLENEMRFRTVTWLGFYFFVSILLILFESIKHCFRLRNPFMKMCSTYRQYEKWRDFLTPCKIWCLHVFRYCVKHVREISHGAISSMFSSNWVIIFVCRLQFRLWSLCKSLFHSLNLSVVFTVLFVLRVNCAPLEGCVVLGTVFGTIGLLFAWLPYATAALFSLLLLLTLSSLYPVSYDMQRTLIPLGVTVAETIFVVVLWHVFTLACFANTVCYLIR